MLFIWCYVNSSCSLRRTIFVHTRIKKTAIRTQLGWSCKDGVLFAVKIRAKGKAIYKHNSKASASPPHGRESVRAREWDRRAVFSGVKAERPVVLPPDLWISLLQDAALLPRSANVTSKQMTRTLVTPKGSADTEVMVRESYLRDICAQTVAAKAPVFAIWLYAHVAVSVVSGSVQSFPFLILCHGVVLELFEWLLMGSEMDFSTKSSKMPWLGLWLPLWAMKFQLMTCVLLEILLSFRKWHGIGSLLPFFFPLAPCLVGGPGYHYSTNSYCSSNVWCHANCLQL